MAQWQRACFARTFLGEESFTKEDPEKQEAVGSNPTESIVIKNKKKEIFAFAFRLKTDVSKESFGVSPSGRRRSKLDADLGFSAGENPFS